MGLGRLQAELRSQAAPSDVSRDRAASSLVLGRMVELDALLPAQEKLIKAAPRHGFRVTRRWPLTGISYASWRQMCAIALQRSDWPVPPSPSAMLPAVLSRYPRTSEGSAASGLRLHDSIPHIGSLALGVGKKRRGEDKVTVLRLEVRPSDEATRILAERQAVMKVLSPAGELGGPRVAEQALTIPLLEVSNFGRRPIASLLKEHIPLPAQVGLGPLDEFDFASEEL